MERIVKPNMHDALPHTATPSPKGPAEIKRFPKQPPKMPSEEEVKRYISVSEERLEALKKEEAEIMKMPDSSPDKYKRLSDTRGVIKDVTGSINLGIRVYEELYEKNKLIQVTPYASQNIDRSAQDYIDLSKIQAEDLEEIRRTAIEEKVPGVEQPRVKWTEKDEAELQALEARLKEIAKTKKKK